MAKKRTISKSRPTRGSADSRTQSDSSRKRGKSERSSSPRRSSAGGKSAAGRKPSSRRSSAGGRKTAGDRGALGAKRNHEQRLQRALANAGLGSRRECETLIEEGRVEVDGKVVTKLGAKVDPRKQKIRVDGSLVKFARLQYFAVNKPPGVVSTSRDPSGRMRVIDLIKTSERVYNVGRLDKSSEGLILVTNDGDLANRLTHPRYEVQKVYLVQVAGRPEVADLKKLQRGVYLAEGLAKVVGTRIKKRTKESTWLEITLEEGRNREIRRLLASIGHKVLRLRRVAIGSLKLGDLPLGAHRRLDKSEVESLWYSSSRQKEAKRKSRHGKPDGKSSRRRTGSADSQGKGRDSRSGKDGRRSSKTPLRSDRSSPTRGSATTRGTSSRSSSSRSSSTSRGSATPTTRKPKPKVGEKGWTPKSGGKRRKKKSTKVTRTAAPKKRSGGKSRKR